ncbi:MAG: hypothetical protein KDC00_03505, partial [Flavobacteriales bacterium]|nr:hypothetical protein [Flavobacteriales bacterium]
MTRIGRLIGAALLSTLFLGPWVGAQGQGDCLNETLYPAAAITPNSMGMVTTISDISYEEEYSQITGILAGASYEFTLESGGYITVREGSFDGPVIGQGSANVTVTTTTTDDIFPHWNTNEDCGTASNGFTTTVQLLLDCEHPTATYTFTEDCDLGAYYIDLDITSTGDGATVDVIVEQFGTPTVTEDVGLGVIQFGPFFPGDDPIVTVAHESDPLCNLPLGLLVPFSGCPITVFCNGPALQQQYCYGNNEVRSWLYVGTGAGTMRLSFTAGGIQGAFGDSLRIYDGTDATGTLLYEHLGTGTTDLTGVVVNGTSGSMYMTMVSNATTSCADGGFNINEWFWEVGCGDCTQPEGTAALVTDCATETFTVEVDITSLGDAAAATINYSVNGGDPQQLANLGLGVTTVGPFPHGDVVDLVLQHGTNAFCEVDLGSFADPGDCPNLINCGAPAEILEYCYTASDSRSWLYEAVGAGTMRLRFLRGTIESNTFDDLRIYDGADNTAPLLFEHSNATTWNLGPVGSAVVSTVNLFYAVEVFASGTNLYMEMSSDGSVQCEGSTTYDSWEWEVVCLDCTLPQASVSVVDDCPNNQFSIPVVVASTGDGAIVNITYTVNGGDPQTVVDVGVGTADLGPFTVGDVVNVTVEHEDNPLCNLAFGDLTDTGECPTLVVCGEIGLEETYCYVANDAQDWRYQASGSGTMRLRFLRGTIESNTFDDLRIYDGPDNTAPLLFEHNNAATWNLGPVGSAVASTVNLFYAVEVFASGTDLYMEMTSDGSVQCNGNTDYDSWEWEVVCLDCTLPQVSYTVVDDCENDQFSIPVTISTTGDGSIVNIVYTVNGGDPQTVVDVGVGTADLGPFALNDTVNVTVEHESNFLCNREFGNITDTGTCPDLVDCGTEVSGALCYNNNADRRYYYRGTGTFPLAVFFDAGLLYAGDSLIVYDGGDITAPRLYAGTNVNVTSLFRNTTNAEHRLTIQVKSNGFTSCVDGFEPEALEWRISCLDCVPATATFNYVQDCANFQYFIDVAITD